MLLDVSTYTDLKGSLSILHKTTQQKLWHSGPLGFSSFHFSITTFKQRGLKITRCPQTEIIRKH